MVSINRNIDIVSIIRNIDMVLIIRNIDMISINRNIDPISINRDIDMVLKNPSATPLIKLVQHIYTGRQGRTFNTFYGGFGRRRDRLLIRERSGTDCCS